MAPVPGAEASGALAAAAAAGSAEAPGEAVSPAGAVSAEAGAVALAGNNIQMRKRWPVPGLVQAIVLCRGPGRFGTYRGRAAHIDRGNKRVWECDPG